MSCGPPGAHPHVASSHKRARPPRCVPSCRTHSRIWSLGVPLTTVQRLGITTAHNLLMPATFLSLLHRDHVDLQGELTRLLDPTASVDQLRTSLDGVRLGLTAHAEAEDIVLGRFDAIAALEVLVAQARAAHLAQEGSLSALVTARPGTAVWRDRARYLRALVHRHAEQEEHEILPALRRLAPSDLYDGLAGAFATERLRQLSNLQPSAPLRIANLGSARS